MSILKSTNALNVASEFATASSILDTKADKSTTYAIAIANGFLDARVDDTEMVNFATKGDTYTKNDIDAKSQT